MNIVQMKQILGRYAVNHFTAAELNTLSYVKIYSECGQTLPEYLYEDFARIYRRMTETLPL